MNGKDIRNNLTTNDIIKYVTYLGARVGKVTDEEINFQTICHGKLDSKHKLYYYTNNKTFYCYNNCGLIGDIFKLTESVLDLSSSEAFKYVCKFFNIPFGLGVDFLYDESLLFIYSVNPSQFIEPSSFLNDTGISFISSIGSGFCPKTVRKTKITTIPTERHELWHLYHNSS